MVRKIIGSFLSRLASAFAANPADREVVDPAGSQSESSLGATGSLQIPCRELADKYFQIGLSNVEKESFEAAAVAFEAALEFDPADHGACHYLGFCHFKLGLYEDAIRLFNKAVEIGPGNPDYSISIGDTYMVMGRYEDAVKSFERVLEAKPDDGLTHAKNAQALMELNALDKAWEYVCRSIELNSSAYAEEVKKDILSRRQHSNRPETTNLGHALDAQGHNIATAEQGERQDSGINHGLSRVYGDLDEVERFLNDASTIITDLYKANPNDERVRSALARVHWKAGRLHRAGAALAYFETNSPDNPHYRLMHGQILKSQGRWAEALEEFKHVWRIAPMTKELYHEIYVTVIALGKHDELTDIFDKALELGVFADAPLGAYNQSFLTASKEFQRHQEEAIARGIPPIIINAQPRSGSTYLQYAISDGLNIPGCYICAATHTYHARMMPTAAKLFARGGAVFRPHWIATPELFADMRRFNLNKILVSIRDPRDTFLSKTSKYERLLGESNWLSELQLSAYPLPAGSQGEWQQTAFKGSLEIDIQLIESWIVASQEQDDIKILITKYDDLIMDEKAVIDRILEFLEIDRDQFSWDKVPDKKDTPYFYRGKSQVWREHLSDGDRELAWSLMTPLVKEYLNLEP